MFPFFRVFLAILQDNLEGLKRTSQPRRGFRLIDMMNHTSKIILCGLLLCLLNIDLSFDQACALDLQDKGIQKKKH